MNICLLLTAVGKIADDKVGEKIMTFQITVWKTVSSLNILHTKMVKAHAAQEHNSEIK